ncbi:MAG TPA: hypothetical protein VI112_01050, partial [Bacteroidia bacterium]
MRSILFLFYAFIFLASCSGSGDKKKDATLSPADSALRKNMDTAAAKKDFTTRFTELINTLGSQDLDELNKYISPEFGLLIIESEQGAMPHFHMQKEDNQSYRHCIENICNTISFDRDLHEEDLPKIDCGSKDFYTKSGSFVQDTNLLNGSEIWKYGDLSPDDQKFTERVIDSISKTVILTSGYTFYFSYY